MMELLAQFFLSNTIIPTFLWVGSGGVKGLMGVEKAVIFIYVVHCCFYMLFVQMFNYDIDLVLTYFGHYSNFQNYLKWGWGCYEYTDLEMDNLIRATVNATGMSMLN